MVFADAYTLPKHNGGGQSMGLRNALYKVARIMGDVNAVKRGKVGKRVARHAAGKATGRTLRKLLK